MCRAARSGVFIGRRDAAPPTTPDGRYFVVRGRLWRCRDPRLGQETVNGLVSDLMQARRALRGIARDDGSRSLHERVDRIKQALGERGAVWWDDGAPDYNRRLAKNTPYASWYEALSAVASGA